MNKFFLLVLSFTSFVSLAFAQNSNSFDLTTAPDGMYVLDKTHGYVTFSYSHQGYSKPWLRFRSVDANLDLNVEDISKSTLDVTIDPASIDSGVDIFDEHLLGKNHFDVNNHPQITFVATDISADGNNIRVKGDLSIKENKAPITLTGQFNRGGLHFRSKKPTLGFSATTRLNRDEWGLGYAVPIVGNEVDVVIEVEFNRIQPLARIKGQPINQ